MTEDLAIVPPDENKLMVLKNDIAKHKERIAEIEVEMAQLTEYLDILEEN